MGWKLFKITRHTSFAALPALSAGSLMYITDENKLCLYDGSNWRRMAEAPVGEIIMAANPTAPAGFLACDGSAISRTTYAALYAAITAVKGAFTVTIATPGVVTLSSHGLITGDEVELTTTGALPTGLSANTNYWVVKVDANTFNLATSLANAFAGTKIATSGSQSGTHTLRHVPYGISGASNFLVPDLIGAAPAGAGSSTGYTANEDVPKGQKLDDRIQGHLHAAYLQGGASARTYNLGNATAAYTLVSDATTPIGLPITDATNGTPRTGATTRGKRVGVNFFIRY